MLCWFLSLQQFYVCVSAGLCICWSEWEVCVHKVCWNSEAVRNWQRGLLNCELTKKVPSKDKLLQDQWLYYHHNGSAGLPQFGMDNEGTCPPARSFPDTLKSPPTPPQTGFKSLLLCSASQRLLDLTHLLSHSWFEPLSHSLTHTRPKILKELHYNYSVVFWLVMSLVLNYAVHRTGERGNPSRYTGKTKTLIIHTDI